MRNFLSRKRDAHDSPATTAVPSETNSTDNGVVTDHVSNGQVAEKKDFSDYDSSASLGVTMRTVVMATLVAMGGFIFGYDTGQISGFLEMPVFLSMFGQKTAVTDAHPDGYYFTNVRSGLIVALVSFPRGRVSYPSNVTSCLSAP